MAILRVTPRLSVIVCLMISALAAVAQESPPPKPVRISFVPPPLEGTLSLGIYDSTGRLVRVLHREAEVEDFTMEADTLSTTWDGRNDAGEPLPAGKYRARGYAVGDLGVDGVGFYFNDWVADEESPHVRAISAIAWDNGQLRLHALIGTALRPVWCDQSGKIIRQGENASPAGPSLEVQGKHGSRWKVDASAVPRLVEQISADGEVVRQLKLAPDEPQPIGIAAATEEDRIFLLEESPTVQRLRALTLLASKQEHGKAVSDWKVEFEKKITKHKDFTIADGKPTTSGGSAPPEKIEIKLQPNPLKKDARETLELRVGFDAAGSYLRTGDGLPLQSISETAHLTRVVLSPRSGNSVDVFQDDEAVVEQFRISNLDQMMGFDCGELELK